MSEGPADFIAMWLATMPVMMMPTALLLARAYRAALRRDRAGEWVGTVAIVSGYLGVWLAFGIVAGLLQAALTASGLLGPGGRLASQLVSGALVATAGFYQFTPWKNAFVAHCRAPLGFLAANWGNGPASALRMGTSFGLHCMGCCWLLFAALFALGTMSIAWMVVLVAIIVLERYGRLHRWVQWGAGVGGVVYGTVLLLI